MKNQRMIIMSISFFTAFMMFTACQTKNPVKKTLIHSYTLGNLKSAYRGTTIPASTYSRDMLTTPVYQVTFPAGSTSRETTIAGDNSWEYIIKPQLEQLTTRIVEINTRAIGGDEPWDNNAKQLLFSLADQVIKLVTSETSIGGDEPWDNREKLALEQLATQILKINQNRTSIGGDEPWDHEIIQLIHRFTDQVLELTAR